MQPRIRATRISVRGARELREKMAELRGPKFFVAALEELAPVAEDLAQEIRAAARAQGAPRDVVDSIFSYSKNPRRGLSGIGQRTRITGLVGVNRGLPDGPSYFEWIAKTGPGVVSRKGGGWSIVRKRAKGTLLGMSLASVWEFGSSNRHARPYFYPTVRRLRAQIARGARAAMERAIERQGID